MQKLNTYSLPFWTIIVILVSINIIVFSMILMTSSDYLRVQYIPDDAYYYLTLARNFSSLSFWTFDSGVSVTSGFHLLFAYFLVILFSLLEPNTYNFVTYSMVISMLFALASVVVMLCWGVKYRNILFLMLLALIISSRNFVYNTISITEWSLTVLVASLYYVWFFTKSNSLILKFTDFLVLFIFGFLGSVARSDFGLLPFSIFVATLIFFSTVSKKYLQFVFIGFLGTLTGLFATFVHNFVFTSEILQSSAKMKAYWAQFGAPNYYAVPALVKALIGFVGLLLFVLFIGTVIFQNFTKNKRYISRFIKHVLGFFSEQLPIVGEHQIFLADRNSKFLFMLVSSGICMMGYTLFYSRNGAIQPWYTANLILPILISIFAIADYMAIAYHHKAKFLFSILFLLAVIFNLTKLYPVNAVNAPWQHQKFMFQAGIYLAENKFNCRIGAWNSGIIGYYEGGNVVNLDGLVNNEIYQYAIHNNLPTYISKKNICYIVDFENMLTIPAFRIRGGYDDIQFIAHLTPKLVFDRGQYEWRYLTVYHIP